MIDLPQSGLKASPIEWFGQRVFIDDLNIDATPEVVTKETIHYAVEIDVSDSINIADEKQIGLFADAELPGNIFRWISERPDYDGSTVVPTPNAPADWTTTVATKWGEGMLAPNEVLGNPNRLININIAGNYGSLSGFTFEVDNVRIEAGNFSGELFFDVLDDNNIRLLNRKIKFYIIINDVFYNVWSGIVAKTSHNETQFFVTCEDDFKNIHKVIPPQIANETLFSNILKKSIGKPIPVTFGFVNHAKLLNVQVENDPVILSRFDGIGRRIGQIVLYRKIKDIDGNITGTEIQFRTGDLRHEKGTFIGAFVRFILDGAVDDAFRITEDLPLQDASSPGGKTHQITIEGGPAVADIVISTTGVSTIKVGTWVEIFDFKSVLVVSNDPISDFPVSNLGAPRALTFFDKDEAEFIDVSEVLELFNLTDIEKTGFPGISALTDILDFEGKFFKLFSFTPKTVALNQSLDNTAQFPSQDFGSIGDELPKLIDRDQLTKNSIQFKEILAGKQNVFALNLLLEMPEELRRTQFVKFYVLIDFDVKTSAASASATDQDVSVRPIDLYNVEPNQYKGEDSFFNVTILKNNFSAGEKVNIRLIPLNYFNKVGGITKQHGAIFETFDLSSFYEETNLFRAYPTARITFSVGGNSTGLGNTVDLDIFEIALAGSKQVSIINDDLFIKTVGEKVSSSIPSVDIYETTNVHRIFEAILQTYDGLLATDLDLDKISSRSRPVLMFQNAPFKS